MLSSVDVYGLIAWITFTYWQLNMSTDKSYNDWYSEKSRQIRCSPPGWLFGVAWFILYGLIAASAFMFTRNYSEDNVYFLATIILLIVNIALNKFWSVAFFGVNARTGLALLIALGMLATEIAILVLMGLSNAWLPFGLFVPYALWTAYAIYLNWQWYSKGLAYEKKKPKEISSKLTRKKRETPQSANRTVRHRLKPKGSLQQKEVIIDLKL